MERVREEDELGELARVTESVRQFSGEIVGRKIKNSEVCNIPIPDLIFFLIGTGFSMARLPKNLGLLLLSL